MGWFDMFGKKKPQPPQGGAGNFAPTGIRDTLYGDLPMAQWKAGDSKSDAEFPWSVFAEARAHWARGDRDAAVTCWRRITEEPALEPRMALQAWHFLSGCGVLPRAADTKQLLGVVVEVSLIEGLDIVAAYADHSARYYNYSGAAIVWERPDHSLDATIDALFAASAHVLTQIGPCDQERPGPPPLGQARLSFLTPGGIHFGQGGQNTLTTDPLGGPVMKGAFDLMQALIAKVGKKK
jgi:hypothetical protein